MSGRRAALILAWVLASGPAFAADPPPGAASCSGCHAPTAPATAIPSLRGRTAADIKSALLAFKADARAATVMDRIAKGFSEAEIDALATWLAGLR